MVTRRRPTSRAFTLVEMLVVLGIIAVLIGLLLPAINMAVNAARRAQISFEISQLNTGIESYRQAKGEYPPSFGEDYTDPARYKTVVERHLQRCYPKFTNKGAFYTALTGSSKVNQAEALVFWLRQTTASPNDPFSNSATIPRVSYCEFDERRLKDDDGDGIYTYVAKNARDTEYLYFEARTYPTYMTSGSEGLDSNNNKVLPYGSRDAKNTLIGMNPTKFQILCAGLDGEWGGLPSLSGSKYNAKEFPSGTNYEPEDLDNITNFSEGKTLGDSRP